MNIQQNSNNFFIQSIIQSNCVGGLLARPTWDLDVLDLNPTRDMGFHSILYSTL